MLLVKEGQLSELTELFERYHVPLYNFFLRLTLDEALSEDLTQDLFYRVFGTGRVLSLRAGVSGPGFIGWPGIFMRIISGRSNGFRAE